MSTIFPVVIHHNPACGTSRNALAVLRVALWGRGVQPIITL